MEAHTVGLIITLVIAWSGLLIGAIKLLLDKYLASQEAMNLVQKENIQRQADDIQRIKDDLSKLRSDLPVEFVRRDDCRNCREEWLRMVNVLDQKLGNFYGKISDKIDEMRKELYAKQGNG
jgi:hypothetical protein